MAEYAKPLNIKEVRRVFTKVEQMTDAAVLATLKKAVDNLIKDINRYWLGEGALDFLGVTGNAYNSITAGVYRKKKLVYINWNGKHVERPTRVTLAEKERYNLPLYYDGDPNKGYTGDYGNGKQQGHQLGPWVMYSHRYDRSLEQNGWSVVVAVPVQYADRGVKIHNAVYNMLEALPYIVNRNIVSVENIPRPEAEDFLPF